MRSGSEGFRFKSRFVFSSGFFYDVCVERIPLPMSFYLNQRPQFRFRHGRVFFTEPKPIKFTVATSHFESMDSAEIREQQLRISAQQMTSSNWILVGDFNFCSYQNWGDDNLFQRGPKQPLENLMLNRALKPHLDCWSHLRPVCHEFLT